MNLVALTRMTIKLKRHLSGHLLTAHRRRDRQQAKTGQTFDVTLHVLRIAHLDPHHLIAATDTKHGSAMAMGLQYGLCTTVTAQFIKVVERRLRAGQDDDICLSEVVGIVCII